MKTTRACTSAGFSIVELLVAVSIVGVLASIAIPGYGVFARKAKNSQAISNLSILYTHEVAFRAEYDTFTTRFGALGYQLSGLLHYNVGFVLDTPPPPEAPQGSATCNEACANGFSVVNCPNVTWTCAPSAGYALDATLLGFANASSFRANAHAHWVNMVNGESFFIDETKTITHIPDGLAN